MTKHFKVKQVADYLQLHWQTILKLIRQGELPAAKIGGRYRISKEDLHEFIERAKRIK